MKTMLLDRTTWDIISDSFNNIAVAADPYSQAQDCASAQRTFLGECWYDESKGVPYFGNILGQPLAASFVRSRYIAAALTVPSVVAARVFFTGLSDARILSGQTQITDQTGNSQTVSF